MINDLKYHFKLFETSRNKEKIYNFYFSYIFIIEKSLNLDIIVYLYISYRKKMNHSYALFCISFLKR